MVGHGFGLGPRRDPLLQGIDPGSCVRLQAAQKSLPTGGSPTPEYAARSTASHQLCKRYFVPFWATHSAVQLERLGCC